jgi:hypothetical protein
MMTAALVYIEPVEFIFQEVVGIQRKKILT